MSKRMLPLLLAIALLVSVVNAAAPKTKIPAPVIPDPDNPYELKQNVVKVLRTTNKAQINRYIPKVYDFSNVNPGAIISFLSRFVQIEDGLVDTYVAKDGKSGKVLVCVPDYQIPMVDRLMAELNRTGLTTASGTKYAYVQLKNRAITDPDIPEILLQYGASDNTITPDVPTNSAFIVGSPSGVDAILNAAGKYDIPTPEINISAKIYEVETTNDGRLGLEYVAWKNGPGRALFSVGAFGEVEKVSGNPRGSQFDSGAGTFGLPQHRMNNSGQFGSYLYDVPSAFFDYLVVKGKGKVLTDASVSGLNKIPAVFRSVEEVPFFRTIPAGPSTAAVDGSDILPVPGGQPLLEVPVNNRKVVGTTIDRKTEGFSTSRDRLSKAEYEESGVVLWVTPTISLENVDMDIVTAVGDILSWSDNGVPNISSRHATAKVRSKSGEEVVLGGIVRDSEIKSTNKIPILGSIPVLGYLFGGEITTKKSTVVTEVITPRCIENCGGLTPAQEVVLRQQQGELNVSVGTDHYGFEQYLLDPERVVREKSFDVKQ